MFRLKFVKWLTAIFVVTIYSSSLSFAAENKAMDELVSLLANVSKC